MNEVPEFSGWRYRAVILSVVGSALGYLGFSLWGGWQDVGNAVGKVGIGGMLLVLLMSLINYTLRFLRWQAYLNVMGHKVRWQPSLHIYLAGFALTTTPGKAGEAVRGVLLKRFGVPYPRSFAAFFSERLSDLLAIVLLALTGLTLYQGARALIIASLVLVIGGMLALSQAGWIERLGKLVAAKQGRVPALAQHMLGVAVEAQRCHRPGMLAVATLLSVVAWSAEAVSFHWILQWMGADVPVLFAVSVYALSMLAGAISFMPGGLGGAEAVMIAMLVWKGVPGPDAIAATVLVRIATLWFAVAIGALAISRRAS